MNDSKKIFTPEQEEKLARLAEYLDEDAGVTNFLYVSAKLIACTLLAMDEFTDERLRSAYGVSTQGVFKKLSRVFIALHIMKIHMLKNDFSKALEKIHEENAAEIDRLLNVFEKED